MISSLNHATDPVVASAASMAQVVKHSHDNVELVIGIVLFVAAGLVIGFGGLLVGRFFRPTIAHPEKGAAYECGEPAIGDGWVQFDLRFYTVALVFIVFDVEVALLWPWAVAFREMGAEAFWPFLVFFLLIAIPFMYEWKSGYLNWVRATGQTCSSVLDEPGGGNRGLQPARSHESPRVGAG